MGVRASPADLRISAEAATSPLLVHLWQYALHLRISGSRQKRQLSPLPVHLWQYALQRIPGSRQKRQLFPLLVPLLPLLRRSLTQDSSHLTSSKSFNSKHRRTRRSAQQHWCLSARQSTHCLYVRELEPHQVLPRLRTSGFLQTHSCTTCSCPTSLNLLLAHLCVQLVLQRAMLPKLMMALK